VGAGVGLGVAVGIDADCCVLCCDAARPCDPATKTSIPAKAVDFHRAKQEWGIDHKVTGLVGFNKKALSNQQSAFSPRTFLATLKEHHRHGDENRRAHF
jgi:hypothetical protein